MIRTVVVASALMALSVSPLSRATPKGTTAVQELPRIAVLDFTNGTVVGAKEADALRAVLGITLAGALRKSGQFDVVERQQLANLLKEQDLGASGRVDEQTAAKIGKVLGARYMLLGTYMIQPDREMLVITRLVEVSTGTVSVAPEVVGDSRAVTGVMTRLAHEVATNLKVGGKQSGQRIDTSRLTADMLRLIDALAKACDKRDSSRVDIVRREIEVASPGHPSLSAPCL